VTTQSGGVGACPLRQRIGHALTTLAVTHFMPSVIRELSTIPTLELKERNPIGEFVST